MATCLVFVFAALVEFAYVNVLCRIVNRRHSFNSNDSGNKYIQKDSFDSALNGKTANGESPPVLGQVSAIIPDKVQVYAIISQRNNS